MGKTFDRDASGNVTVSSAATFYVYGEEKWYDLDALAPPAASPAAAAINPEPEPDTHVIPDVHAHA